MTIRCLTGERSPVSTATRSAHAAGVCVAALGLFALVGWVFDIPFLKSVFPGLAQTKPNTAIGLLALGIALLLTTSNPSPRRQRLARPLAGLAILIGAATLAEYLLGRNLGVDQLIFRDVSSLATAHPGRPAPETAIVLIALGSALLFLQAEATGSRIVAVLAGSSFVLGLSAVIGYAFGVSGVDGTPRIAPVPLLTATAFLLLGAGIAARDPDGVFAEVLTSDGPGSAVARRLLPLALVPLPLIGWLGLQGQQHGLFSAAEGGALPPMIDAKLRAWHEQAHKQPANGGPTDQPTGQV